MPTFVFHPDFHTQVRPELQCRQRTPSWRTKVNFDPSVWLPIQAPSMSNPKVAQPNQSPSSRRVRPCPGHLPSCFLLLLLSPPMSPTTHPSPSTLPSLSASSRDTVPFPFSAGGRSHVSFSRKAMKSQDRWVDTSREMFGRRKKPSICPQWEKVRKESHKKLTQRYSDFEDSQKTEIRNGINLPAILTERIVWTQNIDKLRHAFGKFNRCLPTSPILCADYQRHVIGHNSSFIVFFFATV